MCIACEYFIIAHLNCVNYVDTQNAIQCLEICLAKLKHDYIAAIYNTSGIGAYSNFQPGVTSTPISQKSGPEPEPMEVD